MPYWHGRSHGQAHPLKQLLEPGVFEQPVIARIKREVLEIHYRGDHDPESVKRVLSRAIRLGLPELNQAQLNEIAGRYGNLERAAVQRAMAQLRGAEALDSGSHTVLERLMAAIDVHLEGAALRAAADYRHAARAAASLVAILLGAVVGLFLWATTVEGGGASFLRALFLGVIAVPVAPIAKDLATAIKNFSVRT